MLDANRPDGRVPADVPDHRSVAPRTTDDSHVAASRSNGIDDEAHLRSRLREVEALLEHKSRILDGILEHTVQGLMLVNGEHVVEVCNRRAIELLGLPADLMARRPAFIEVLEYQWSTDEFAKTPDELKHFVREGGILDQAQCYERIRPDGCVIEVQSVPLVGGGILRTYTDITERRRVEDRIRHRANHDGLTSLLNRETFIEALSERIMDATIGGHGIAVHYLDLDRFKSINDRMGHTAGDKVLVAVAERMRSVARESDAVARIGGDEFVILQSPVEQADQAMGLARRLLQVVEGPIEVDGREVRVGLSIGIALFPQDGVTADGLISSADLALYRVKADGGHGARVFGA